VDLAIYTILLGLYYITRMSEIELSKNCCGVLLSIVLTAPWMIVLGPRIRCDNIISPCRTWNHSIRLKDQMSASCTTLAEWYCLWLMAQLRADVITCTPAMLQAGIVFGSICLSVHLSVCLPVRTKSRKLLIRNWFNLVGICPMVNAKSG